MSNKNQRGVHPEMTSAADSSLTQRNRFIKTARELGADKDDGTLDRVLGKVAPPVRPNPPKTDKEPKKAE